MANPLRFDPSVPETLLAALVRPLEVLDLPPARSVLPLRVPSRVAHYGLTLEDERRVLLQVALDELDGNGFYSAIAASRLAEGESIPFVRPAVALSWNALGAAALVSSPPLGIDLLQRIGEGTVDRVSGFRRIGQLLAEITDVPAPTMGTLATADGFRPRRTTWAGEWTSRIERLSAVARSRGTALAGLADALVDRIDPSALIETAPVLVHGGLSPGAVYLSNDDRVAGILGWEDSWAGDALSGFGPLLHLPAEGLAVVLEGWGRPVDAGRLQVYEATFALQLLAEASMGATGPLRTAARVERAADIARLALSGSLEARLGQAQHAGTLDPPPATRRARTRIRAAMEALRLEPAAPDGGQAWQVVASTAVLAHRLGASEHAAGWGAVADRMLGMLPTGLVPRPQADALEVDAWWADQWRTAVASLVSLEPGPIRTDALSLLGTAWAASERLDHALDPSALAGLEDLLAGARLRQQRGRPSGSAEQLASAIHGIGALHQLSPALGEVEGADALKTRLREQARAAWDVFEVVAPADPPNKEQLVAHFSVEEHHANQSTPVAPLVLALKDSSELGLPAHPGALLAALGVHP